MAYRELVLPLHKMVQGNPEKVVFIAFAKEDEAIRNLFTGQRIHPTPRFASPICR